MNTSRPSDPVDFEIFDEDVFVKLLTGVCSFTPGYNAETYFVGVGKRQDDRSGRTFPRWHNVSSGDFPGGFLFSPGWNPATGSFSILGMY